ncbi:MAG: hypothetical protein QG635_2461 [Bacteroidota bacterium]|nr:hypothetical protein [Bacteroidota bacterium]
MKNKHFSARNLALIILAILFLTAKSNAGLRDLSNQYDYIIIYHSEFTEQIKRFADWRQSKGFDVITVNVNDIYSEFSYIQEKNEQIRECLRFAAEDWKKPSPKYALLVGSVFHIPSFKVASEFTHQGEDSVTIDGMFALHPKTNEYVQMLALGRFPVRDTNELNNIIDKTIFFEDSSKYVNYKNDFIVTVDSADFESFSFLAEDFLSSAYFINYKIKRAYFHPDKQNFCNKDDFFKYLYQGANYLCNYLHGNPDCWTLGKIITSADIDTANFTNKPFILTEIACSQNFDNPEKEGIVEKLINKKSGGAVAAYISSGLNWAHMSSVLLRDFYDSIYKYGYKTIGEAVKSSKESDNSFLAQRYTLLGDPALAVPKNLPAGINFHYSSTTKKIDNPVKLGSTMNIRTDDNEIRDIVVYDIMGNAVAGFNPSGTSADGYTSYDIPATLSSGVYFLRVNAGKSVRTDKFIIIK